MPPGSTKRTAALVVVAIVLAQAGCTVILSGATPEFARRPYAPFSREAAVAIALREWRLFGAPYDDRRTCPPTDPPARDDTPERRAGLWQRVGEYRWIGLDPGHPRRRATGKHDPRGRVHPPERDATYAWSAAFVSYVMRIAGAGDRFPYDDVHATYINAAARAARRGAPVRGLVARRPDRYAPRRGDLVCAGRESAADLRFEDLPAGDFPSHCNLVVDARPGAILVVGGNVADAVTMTRLPVTADGMLANSDGTVVDACAAWCAVLAVPYED